MKIRAGAGGLKDGKSVPKRNVFETPQEPGTLCILPTSSHGEVAQWLNASGLQAYRFGGKYFFI